MISSFVLLIIIIRYHFREASIFFAFSHFAKASQRSSGNILNSFWDIETSGQTISSGGTGLTTAEMQTESTFTDAGWDFVGETANGTEDIWWILEGQDYPRLWWEAAEE